MIGRRVLIGGGLAASLLAPRRLLAVQAQGTTVTVAFELADNRVVIPAKIGAQGPFRFALDTGGQLSIIDGELARKLGLKKVPGRTLTSVGGRNDEPWYVVNDLQLAAGRLPPMPFIELARGLGRERGISGSLGAALFTSRDTDLDFGKSELRLYPDGRPDRAGWTRLKSRFILGSNAPPLPAVEVEIDGFRVDLAADTGAPGNITLDAPASRASGLWDDGKAHAPTGVRGIGAALARRRIVRAGRVTIGPFAFDGPLVALSPPDTGEDYIYTGVVGLGILSRMNLSSDVKAKALWAQSSGTSYVPRTNYSLSGLWMAEKDGRVVIDDVGTGSPAKAAGIMAGDVVVGLPFARAIASITGRQGQEIALKLERNGVAREVRFTLAEYL